jgi:hypothetical protein
MGSLVSFPTFVFLIYFYKPKQVTFCSKQNVFGFFIFFDSTCWFTPLLFYYEKRVDKNTKTDIQLSTVDLLARVSMKNVAKCDK